MEMILREAPKKPKSFLTHYLALVPGKEFVIIRNKRITYGRPSGIYSNSRNRKAKISSPRLLFLNH